LEDEQYERDEVHIYMLGLRRGLVLDDATLGGLIAKLIRLACNIATRINPRSCAAYQPRDPNGGLNELSDKELREKLSTGELSDKKATIARALLRRRRQERFQAWLKRHAWLGAIFAAIGLVGIFSLSKGGSEDVSEE
jgi:hypothetical protein